MDCGGAEKPVNEAIGMGCDQLDGIARRQPFNDAGRNKCRLRVFLRIDLENA
jgi:hypothetical protein